MLDRKRKKPVGKASRGPVAFIGGRTSVDVLAVCVTRIRLPLAA